VTQVFWGFIKIMVLEAFYRASSKTQPLSLAEVITYTWLGQAFFMMLPYSANPDPDVRVLIRSGAIVYELARPLDLYRLWLARAVANRLAPTLLRCLPIFALAVPFLGMGLPPSFAACGAWLLAMIGALALVSALSVIITATLMWTVSGDGIARIVPSLVLLLSGLIIPLPLFPDSVRPVLDLLPFRGMADAPFRLYMGHLPPSATGGVLLHQAVWLAVFVAFGKFLVHRGTRYLVVQGG
jgi:ABC-2 type transport system permease protein